MKKHTPSTLQPQLPFDEIEPGYCHCGCGQKTTITPKSCANKHLVKGQPKRFIAGHNSRLRQTTPLTELFWSKIDKRGPDDCWEWTAARDPRGYGQHVRETGSRLAHRIAYELHNGEIPSGNCVLHKCDNPPCCNPGHLFLGTKADNVKDCIEKGRRSHHGNHGESHHQAKLTVDDVRAIRQQATTKKTYKEIAKEFGISFANVGLIVTRKTWRDF